MSPSIRSRCRAPRPGRSVAWRIPWRSAPARPARAAIRRRPAISAPTSPTTRRRSARRPAARWPMQLPAGSITFTAQPSWTLSAIPSPTSFTAAGQAIGYSYTLTNTGNVGISSISVSGTKTGTISCLANTLAVGASTTCTSSYPTVAGRSRLQHLLQRDGDWHADRRHAGQCSCQRQHHLHASAVVDAVGDTEPDFVHRLRGRRSATATR